MPKKSVNRIGSGAPDPSLNEPCRLSIRLLGELALQYDAEPFLTAAWTKQKPLALLGILLTFRNMAVPKDRLIEWLWPHLETASAANSLRVSIGQLRQALRPPASSAPGSVCIRTRHEGYCLESNGAWIDVDEFQADYNAGARAVTGGDLAEAQKHLEAALLLYRGDYMQNLPYEEWARPERQRLRALDISALAGLAGIHALSARYESAIPLYEQILSLDECHEVTYVQLMRCMYALGDRVGAVRTFEKCRERLNAELGLTPMPETEALYQQIVDNETNPPLDFVLNLQPTLSDS